MNRIEIDHGLSREDVETRMRDLAARHDIAMTVTAPGQSGELTKKVPLLGSVQARYDIGPDTLVIDILKAPGAVKNTVQRMLEDELGKALA